MMRGVRDESRPVAPAVLDFDEVAIRPAPQKPFETAESPNRDLLALSPCDFCGRKFNATNLSRHVTICERLAHKPKREAFATVAQRLSHVAQEDTVKPVIRQGLERRAPEEEPSNDIALKTTKNNKKVQPARKKSPARGGRTGTDLFREQQKGHSKCKYCERTFREEAYERHVEFCKSQYLAKQRRRDKEDPRSDLLMRRVKYRPPLPRTNSKESPVLPRKAISAFSTEQKPASSSAVRPVDLKVLGSQSAMARMNPPGNNSKTPTDLNKLTGKLQNITLSDYSSGVNGQLQQQQPRQRIITPYQDRTSPSDYGSGESLLSRAGSVRAVTKPVNANHANGLNRQVVIPVGGKSSSIAEHDGSGDGSSVESILSRTGSVRVKGATAVVGKSIAADNVHKIYHSGDLLARTGSIRTKKVTPVPGTPVAAMLSKTMGHHGFSSLLDDAIRSNGGKIKLHNTPEYLKSSGDSINNTTNSAERPYPFNVASAQKEEMMQIHRTNSVRAKNSSVDSSVDWDSFLKPAVLLQSGTPEKDDHRLFQWERERYRAPQQRNPVKLADFSRDESRINESLKANDGSNFRESSGRSALYGKSGSSLSESLEETDNSSDSISPISPSLMGSTSSVKSSAIGSSLSSIYGVQKPHHKAYTNPAPPKFCHNCGNEFPIPNASFCCHCGIARLVTRLPIS